MRYIKLFEAFGDSDDVKDIVQNIKDICIDLQHSGYMTLVYSMNDADKKKIKIDICYKVNNEFMAFEYYNVSEVFERIIDYVTRSYGLFTYEIELKPSGGDISTKRVYNNNSSKRVPEDNVESRQFNLILTL